MTIRETENLRSGSSSDFLAFWDQEVKFLFQRDFCYCYYAYEVGDCFLHQVIEYFLELKSQVVTPQLLGYFLTYI